MSILSLKKKLGSYAFYKTEMTNLDVKQCPVEQTNAEGDIGYHK